MSGWGWLLLLGMLLALIPWLLYPALTGLLAGLRPTTADRRPSAAPGPISIVLATREPPAAVRARLENLVGGDWPADHLELIVAVDGDPGSYQFAGLVPTPRRLMVVGRGADPGKAAALNAGVAAAASDLVIFADTAQRFAPDAISRLVAAMSDGRFGAISGALAIGNEAAPSSPIARYWRLERRLREAEARLHSTIGVTGSIYAMRRSLWLPLPVGLILDDLWIPMRLVMAGHRVGFEPGAVARDLRTTTPAQEHQRKVRTLTGNLQLLAWMPGLLLPWRNPVWVQFLCHKLLRLATPFALLAIVAGTLGSAFARSAAVAWGLLGVAATAALVTVILPGTAGRRIRGAVVWGLAMQSAIVKATWNGIRGRWDVWQT